MKICNYALYLVPFRGKTRTLDGNLLYFPATAVLKVKKFFGFEFGNGTAVGVFNDYQGLVEILTENNLRSYKVNVLEDDPSLPPIELTYEEFKKYGANCYGRKQL